ncbi:tRNA (cytosine(34)-C(5))-methyltransferase isoform X2 [Daktulosphaira vitifoliae]|uniref:tRNA (cytosine(34)-C(5))-methyltransferase isoform X2 n=1 Tax=Daktulosphaira vitifoliae TaxID=58002 RepID=UPI0021AAB1EC|nr:tRNA (cytosine(34)-C(5))-methyltransferase isoform X2 [Daktulosphaira vitifoliae]
MLLSTHIKDCKNKAEVSNKPKEDTRSSYESIVRHNDKFLQYYKMQGICKEDEWDEFVNVLKTDLPTSFRITGSSDNEAKALLKMVEGVFFTDLLKHEQSEQLSIAKPFCLPWYPQRLGWQLKITRKDIRGSEAYYRLHNFLISETENGNISRQETVSMIPPILLKVKPSDKVLDMCAAPGSKTAQLIEALYSGSNIPVPDGLIVANDVHNARCYMLVHQAKRLNSANIVITNHDATVLPALIFDENVQSVLKFDKILCDAPCSGDGTLRKNPDIWTKWSPGNGNNLHGIQFRILKRGLELLNIGGRLVYSTCSFNPVENEAVINRILTEAAGSVQLIDAHNELEGLQSTQGLVKWKVVSKDLDTYEIFDEVPEKWSTQIRPQMFPPIEDKHNLTKCIRILPHHQDTGGFFVAVLIKIKSLPWEVSPQEMNLDDKTTENKLDHKRKQKKNKYHGYKEDPFVFMDENDIVWPEIRDFYELSNFPVHCLLTRCSIGKKKNIYYTSSSIKDIVKNNQDRVKIINTGVKTFVRCDNKSMGCNFRLAQEGLPSITQFIGSKRRVQLNRDEIIMILKNPTVPIINLRDNTKEKLDNFGVGSCILNMINEDFPLELVGWRGFSTLKAYINGECSIHYLRILGVDVTEFDINKFKKDKVIENEHLRPRNFDSDLKENDDQNH